MESEGRAAPFATAPGDGLRAPVRRLLPASAGRGYVGGLGDAGALVAAAALDARVLLEGGLRLLSRASSRAWCALSSSFCTGRRREISAPTTRRSRTTSNDVER
jgi:hypothetical protein